MANSTSSKNEIIRVPNATSITERQVDALHEVKIIKYPKGVTLRFISSRDGSQLPTTQEATLEVRFSRKRFNEKGDSLHFFEHLKLKQIRDKIPETTNGGIDCNGDTNTFDVTFTAKTTNRSTIPAFNAILQSLFEPLDPQTAKAHGQVDYITSEMIVRKNRIMQRVQAIITKKLLPSNAPAAQIQRIRQTITKEDYESLTPQELIALQERVSQSEITITVTNISKQLQERLATIVEGMVSTKSQTVLKTNMPKTPENYLTDKGEILAQEIGESPEVSHVRIYFPIGSLQMRSRNESGLFKLFSTKLFSGGSSFPREIAYTPPGIYWGNGGNVDQAIGAFFIQADVPFQDTLAITQNMCSHMFTINHYVNYIERIGWENIQQQLINNERELLLREPARLLYWNDLFGNIVSFKELDKLIRNFSAEEFLRIMQQLTEKKASASIFIASANPDVTKIGFRLQELKESNNLFS